MSSRSSLPSSPFVRFSLALLALGASACAMFEGDTTAPTPPKAFPMPNWSLTRSDLPPGIAIATIGSTILFGHNGGLAALSVAPPSTRDTVPPTLRWRTSAMGNYDRSVWGAAAGASAYFVLDSRLNVYDAATGALRWRDSTTRSADDILASDGERVYVHDAASFFRSRLVAYDSTGAVAWRFAPDSTDPLCALRCAFVGATVNDGAVTVIANAQVNGERMVVRIVLDRATGVERTRQLRMAATHPVSGPVVSDGTRFFLSSGDGSVAYAFTLGTGALAWQRTLPKNSNAPTYPPDASLRPMVDNGLYVPTIGNRVYAFDAATGALRWSASFYFTVYGVAACPNHMVVGTTTGGVALARADGAATHTASAPGFANLNNGGLSGYGDKRVNALGANVLASSYQGLIALQSIPCP